MQFEEFAEGEGFEDSEQLPNPVEDERFGDFPGDFDEF